MQTMMKKFLPVLLVLLVFESTAQLDYLQHDYAYLVPSGFDSEMEYDQNHEYYADKYRKASAIQKAGIGLTSAGVGLILAGGILILNSEDVDDSDRKAGDILSIMGFVSFGTGVPLWIIGGSMKLNNRKAMENCQRGAELSLKTTNNGVGLVLNF